MSLETYLPDLVRFRGGGRSPRIAPLYLSTDSPYIPYIQNGSPMERNLPITHYKPNTIWTDGTSNADTRADRPD
jgi:hypothetical protein